MSAEQSTPKRLYRGHWHSVDNLAHGDVTAIDTDGAWPAMVNLNLEGPSCEFGFLMTALDAQNLAADLRAAAAEAQLRNREVFQ